MKKEFSQHGNFFLLFTFAFLLLCSCSVEKQIAKSAKTDVLDAKALQTAHVGISIFDPATNNYLYNYQGDKYFVPASNTKIPTCYAAMKYLGDSLVGLRYRESNDSLFIESTCDPTFLMSEYKKQPVYAFLKNSNKKIFWRDVFWNDDHWGSGWSWNDYLETYMANKSYHPIYGNLLTVKNSGGDLFEFEPSYFKTKVVAISPDAYSTFDLGRSFDRNDIVLGKGDLKLKRIPFYPDFETVSRLLKDTLKKEVYPSSDFLIQYKNKIHSQPTDSLLKPMMHRSDNFFAEQSLLMVSNEMLGVMNDAKIIDTILKTDFKDLPQKPRWVDGSGLSRYNLFTPQDFVAILNKMQKEFPIERIKEIFPTGGEGTISSYYKADSGYIYAKTGTLSGVVAFSGFLYTKKGKLLIFSTLVNNHQASATDVRRAIEKFLQGVRNKY